MGDSILRNKFLVPIGLVFSSMFCTLALSGENSWTTSGPEGGNIMTIAFHPIDHNILFLGTIGDGIYKSCDSGANWIHLPIGNLISTVWVIQFNPFGPDTMYAGTAAGIFKSVDAGISWVRLPIAPNPYSAFATHPDSSGIMFAGFVGGFKSYNGGDNWYPLNLPTNTGVDRIIIDPVNTNIIYIIGGNTPWGDGIFKSTDCGESWFCSQNNLDSTGYCRELAVDPVDDNIIYLARSQSADESSRCLSKSTNGGQEWIDITPTGVSDSILCDVIVSPFEHNTIYAASSQDGVFKSTDGGQSWVQKNNGLHDLICHSIEIDPVSGVLFLCLVNDGIYESIDGGEHWIPIGENINMTSCLDLAINPSNHEEIFLSATNGLFRSTDTGASWQRQNIGNPQKVQLAGIKFDRIDPNFIYGCSVAMPHTGYPPGFWRSLDRGANWEFRNAGLPDYTYYVDMAISYSQNFDRRIFLASYDGLYYSDNFGESWEEPVDGLPPYNTFYTIDVNLNDYNIIAAGDYYNHVYISRDRGIHWHRTTDPPHSLTGSITELKFDPQNDSCLYISSLFSGVLKSTNLGQSWLSILGDLPVDPQTPQYPITGGIAINPYNSNNIFISSTHMGIYQSHDGGIHWISFNMGLDTAGAFSNRLYLFPDDTTRLILPAIMRSVWSIHRTLDGIDDNSPALPFSLSLSSYPNPFNAQTTISYSLPEPGRATLTIYNLLGQKVATLYDGEQTAGEHSLVWDAKSQPSGVYFAKIESERGKSTTQMVLLK
jgi:photosystem II stability/assembly factor-like uncharacterized protein